ncbi:hypothetical protein O6H91_08G114100 [Diphasiastrum complanatum]|uniref:Uncharacterized protein n=1 Tax=Diphasiastrum complanatum TaxID=34168 RepID=A0ACC2D154_DIPCM|nr:hypothetical protein O6H91_Y469200 [Diphasiastrum complanatum]KAJ7548024.1 hypothetical protein O6H91_08G114100 [Diphasiastrum complanatum]
MAALGGQLRRALSLLPPAFRIGRSRSRSNGDLFCLFSANHVAADSIWCSSNALMLKIQEQVLARCGSTLSGTCRPEDYVVRFSTSLQQPIPFASHKYSVESLNHMVKRLFSNSAEAVEGDEAGRFKRSGVAGDDQKRAQTKPNMGRSSRPTSGKTYFRLLAARLRKELEEAGDKEERVRILNARKGRELNIRKFWEPFIDALQKGSSADLAIEVFNWQRKELKRIESSKLYAKMIAFAGVIGRPHLAVSWFEDMRNRRLSKSTSSCNALIFAFAKNKEPEKALAIFESMKGLNGCPHNIVTYNTLISMYGSMGELEKMETVFEECQTAGFIPERITYNTLLHAYLKNGKFDKLEDVYKIMVANDCKPDVVTFNALMLGYCRAVSVEKMEAGQRDMQTANIPITAMVAEEMVRVYMKTGMVDRVAKVIEIVEGTPETRYTTQLHNIILECYANAGQLDGVEDHFERILNRKKAFASSSALEAVVKAFVTKHSFERLHNLYRKLKEPQCWDLFASTFDLLIVEYAKGELFDKMEQVFVDMEAAGHRPAASALHAIYEGRTRTGNEAGAQEIKERMMQDDLIRNNSKSDPSIVKAPITAQEVGT